MHDTAMDVASREALLAEPGRIALRANAPALPQDTRRPAPGFRRGGGRVAVVMSGSLPRTWWVMRKRSAIYPAGHSPGHRYHAGPGPATPDRATDSTYRPNPGIGEISKHAIWQ